MLLCLVKACEVYRGDEQGVDLAGDITLRAPGDLRLGLALAGASLRVILGRLMPLEPHEHDAVERCVGLSVSTPVEAMPGRLARASELPDCAWRCSALPYRTNRAPIAS